MKTALTILTTMRDTGGVVAALRDHRAFWFAMNKPPGQQEEIT